MFTKRSKMIFKMRYLLLGGFLLSVLATIVSWLLTNELSPLNEYLLWHTQMRNFWGMLNIPSYIIGALTAGNPHNVNIPAAYTAFFIQWMLIGIIITAILRLFMRPRPR